MSAPNADRSMREQGAGQREVPRSPGEPPPPEEVPAEGAAGAKSPMEQLYPTVGVPLEARAQSGWAPGRYAGWRQIASAFVLVAGLLVLLWLLGLFGV